MGAERVPIKRAPQNLEPIKGLLLRQLSPFRSVAKTRDVFRPRPLLTSQDLPNYIKDGKKHRSTKEVCLMIPREESKWTLWGSRFLRFRFSLASIGYSLHEEPSFCGTFRYTVNV